MYNRLLSSILNKSAKSSLILGPRQVCKSTLIQQMNFDLKINLASEKEFFLFQTEPRKRTKRKFFFK